MTRKALTEQWIVMKTPGEADLSKALVTGGAGFIGSHLVEALVRRGEAVVVVDNLSSGRTENLSTASKSGSLELIRMDLKNPSNLREILSGVSVVYHFAANPEVRLGQAEPSVHFHENLLVTFNLLEAMRKSGGTKTVVFTSTSTVYGEARQLPTCEDYGPLLPISTYGATKLGCESLISSYAYTHGLKALILRLGNCVGARSGHGVIPDFIKKLKENPTELEILGDGSQTKSYVHISDCVSAVFMTFDAFMRSPLRVDVYNVSSVDQVSVQRIGEIVAEELRLVGVRMRFTGGVDGGRGWFGDVKQMHLSVEKLRRLGWAPKLSSEGAVRAATKELIANET
jgi:UDP-glucose 4-epimerase